VGARTDTDPRRVREADQVDQPGDSGDDRRDLGLVACKSERYESAYQQTHRSNASPATITTAYKFGVILAKA
jgi:hypothetical protein